ncbi:uncharacterized protein A1O5_10634 [Cladophialophora psammophila CBS 110553]|uniref:NmrA-like domain-containing protein n=1 Tax=Cladophialophora psammophila CBS 110553 TaxID=1182543 RepID=W9WED7_9EURO|nr:uncharacterized protein A1O5_10634 [Cladophialophora psammophila CBS 110553]EXJ66482.1 hypothetical protein A1O5_10634 [Cladophialophora psammophila CBS 110553]
MVVVAVAGGLGDVGRTIVEEIHRSQRHQVYVLTRQKAPGSPSRNVPECFPSVLEVDYSSRTALSEVLAKYNVDTVISTLNLHWPGADDAQLNLIQAAAECGTVTRFLPSEFNIDYNAPEEDMPYPPRVKYLQAVEELRRNTTLTFTLVRNGFFMDYLGLPFAETHLHPLYCILDISAGKAVIPGDGNCHVVFTHTRDVAKFVNELLDLPAHQWPKESAIIGERITLNELVEAAERCTGRRFHKTHDEVSAIRKGATTELPSNNPCYSYFPGGKEELDGICCTQMIGMVAGVFDIKGTELNKLFPHVQTIRLEHFLRTCWEKAGENNVHRAE